MKSFSLLLMVNFILLSNSLRANDRMKMKVKEDECEKECVKVSLVSECYCDKECVKYQDCCKIFLKQCGNYFNKHLNSNSNSETKSEESCCNNSSRNINCFCDKHCEKFGDCCSDYNKCNDNHTKPKRKAHIGIYENWKHTLTPQLETVYVKSK